MSRPGPASGPRTSSTAAGWDRACGAVPRLLRHPSARKFPPRRTSAIAPAAGLSLGLGQRVHVGEPILDQGPRLGLWHMAGEAGIAPGREAAERIALAVLV